MQPKEPQLDDDFARDYHPGDEETTWMDIYGIDRPEDADQYFCEDE